MEDQLRKRAFHALFGLDRTISASLGRPLAMQEEDFDLTPALDISDEALDDWELHGKGSPIPSSVDEPRAMSGMACVVSLQRITGQVLRRLYTGNSPHQTTESVCFLDSLLNECEWRVSRIKVCDLMCLFYRARDGP